MARPAPAFRSPAGEAAFVAAYDALLARWPDQTETRDLAGEFGTTRVTVCGRPGSRALVLLPGGGATGMAWYANVAAWGRTHRVYAVDPLGQAGRSVHSGRALRTTDDLMVWLDGVLDALALPELALAGHSYGGWIALRHALHAPQRVRRLILVDPTTCFVGMAPAYLLHAVPILLRPSGRGMRQLIRWETRKRPPDSDVVRLAELGATQFRASKVVMPTRPGQDELVAVHTPTLLVLAGQSRCHDISRLEQRASRVLPDVRSVVLPDASHHGLPSLGAARLDAAVADFLAAR